MTSCVNTMILFNTVLYVKKNNKKSGSAYVYLYKQYAVLRRSVCKNIPFLERKWKEICDHLSQCQELL